MSRDADASLSTPDEHALPGEPLGEVLRVRLEEAHVARALLARRGRDHRIAALHEALAQLAGEVEHVVHHGAAIETLVDGKGVVEHEEAEEVRIPRLEPGGIGTEGQFERSAEPPAREHPG